MAPFLHDHPEGVILAIKVVPNASRSEIAGIQGEELKVRVTSPPAPKPSRWLRSS
ncbi:MAG: DUF167 domain-containing protein [Planctomycetota bacterium]|jgi:uncharacterized protein YggU (UPF0235/DUF167 family)